MDRKTFSLIESEMLKYMNDGAHDKQHIYRVLYYAVDIAKDHKVDIDVLIAAALLHDIGREAQFKNNKIDHATHGANVAYEYIITLGWNTNKAEHIKQCISTHRYRKNSEPQSIEAKILFDADKIDVSGTIGIARTLAYKGIVAEPLYSLDAKGNVMDGIDDDSPSFFQEYNFKLKNLYNSFYTDKAKKIAMGRKEIAQKFYECMVSEVTETYRMGLRRLEQVLVD